MNERQKKEVQVFNAALEIAVPAERAAYLTQACAGDPAMREKVEVLLRDQSKADEFFATRLTSAAAPGPTATHLLPATENPGDRIGRYKLLQQIGEGGCGTVYMAEQEEPVRRRVALKVIRLGMDTKTVVARFEAERQALALMDHPNIAKIYDGGDTASPRPSDGKGAGGEDHLPSDLCPPTSAPGRPYFVMELVRGIKITEYCDQAQLSTGERLKLFIQVCQAVQHAHQKGIIHRDIKPSNILVTVNDGVAVPKVIDFGIAKATDQRLTDKTYFTEFHSFIGTPAYTSPEQAEMSSLDIDTRSDIYSLGVLLYEMLTGQTPFPAERLLKSGLDEMRRIIREEEPVKPSTRLTQERLATRSASAGQSEIVNHKSQIPSDLDWIVMKALEKDRTRRYATSLDFAADLQRHLDHEPVLAGAPSNFYKLQKLVRRNKGAFAAAAAVAVALVIGLGFSTWAFFKEREARTRALSAEAQQSREREKAEQARQTATVERDRAATLLSVSQAGHGVELLEKSDPAGLLYLLEARKSVEHLPEERMRRTLLWSGWMNSLPKAEVRVLQTTNILDRAGYDPSHPWQATGSTNGEIILWESKTGKQITKFTTGNQRVGSPEFSANGRLLVVNAGGTRQLWNLAPVPANQPPVRLVRKVSRYAFDAKRLRVVTYANEGMPVPGEPNTDLPTPVSQVQVWDSSLESALVSTWDGDRSDLSNHQFALSPDGSKVATGWRSLNLWDAKTGRPMVPQVSTNGVSGSRGFFDLLFFSPDGRWLWETRGNTCRRYDMTTGQPAGNPIVGLHRRNRPEVSPAGQHLILSLEKGFQVVQLDGGGNMGPLIARDDDLMHALALSPDGGKLATAGPGRAVRMWDTRTGQQSGRTLMPPTGVGGATFSPDGNWLSISTQDGRSRTHSLTPQPAAWVKQWAGVKVIGFNAQGRLLTYEPGQQRMEWRDPGTGKATSPGWTVTNHGPVFGSALSSDGGTAAAAFRTGKTQSLVRLWNTATGTPLEPAITWTNLGALAFSPDGRTLAGLGGGDGSGSIQLWDVASRQPQSFLASPPMEVTWFGLRFSPDSRFIAARNSYVTYVWDVAAGRLASGAKMDLYMAISEDWTRALTDDLLDFTDPRQSRPAPNPANSRGTSAKRGGLALSPDGRLRVAGAGNKSVRLWDNISGRPVGQEMKLANPSRQSVFSPDSRLLAVFEWGLLSGRADAGMTLRLWDTSTGLPCGPALPLAEQPFDFLFDREVRFLAIPAWFETTGAMIVQLPNRELPLAEMERQSLLLAGSRLDEAGNIEILSADEIQQLEWEK